MIRNLITGVILIVLIAGLIFAGQSQTKDVYQILRLNGYSPSKIDSVLSLPTLEEAIEDGKVFTGIECLVVAPDFRQIYVLKFTDSCKPDIEMLVNIGGKK